MFGTDIPRLWDRNIKRIFEHPINIYQFSSRIFKGEKL